MTHAARGGPLHGIRVIEFAGIGPGPVCGMLLADMGAQLLLVERPDGAGGIPRERRFEVGHRGKASLVLDLKRLDVRDYVSELIERADVVIEGYRPGVMERMGLGPDVCLARNPRLIYGRMTGYGQHGVLSARAGHDLNYISLSGVLHAIGRAGHPPTPPLNLVGDYAGGSMLLALGIAAALTERAGSGLGQVIDAAMVEGSALLMAAYYGMRSAGMMTRPRGENILDSGAPFYDVYLCSDGRYVAFAAIEHRFREVFAERTGFPREPLLNDDPTGWPSLRLALSQLFARHTRDHWCKLLEDSDACVTPVLEPDEVPEYPHNAQRQSFIQIEGVPQPAPAPRFSRSVADMPGNPPIPGEGGCDVVKTWGMRDPPA